MSSVAGEGLDDFVRSYGCRLRLRVILETLPLPCSLEFSSGSYSYPSRSAGAIWSMRWAWKRKLEAAQSKASKKDVTFFRLDIGRLALARYERQTIISRNADLPSPKLRRGRQNW